MSTSERIRFLGEQGLSTSEIAARLGIRYQHAYQVLRKAGAIQPKRVLAANSNSTRSTDQLSRPPLTASYLEERGFHPCARWSLEDDRLVCDGNAPSGEGVYAFALGDTVMYIGVATMGIRHRLYFYSKPGPRQLTNIRLNDLIRRALASEQEVSILVAEPCGFEWNGIPVNGAAGLELGLIRAFSLPWNRRSTGVPKTRLHPPMSAID